MYLSLSLPSSAKTTSSMIKNINLSEVNYFPCAYETQCKFPQVFFLKRWDNRADDSSSRVWTRKYEKWCKMITLWLVRLRYTWEYKYERRYLLQQRSPRIMQTYSLKKVNNKNLKLSNNLDAGFERAYPNHNSHYLFFIFPKQ